MCGFPLMFFFVFFLGVYVVEYSLCFSLMAGEHMSTSI